ncbi:MAG: hypothetical protein ACOY5U_02575 [Pseudomonadota bacterium]
MAHDLIRMARSTRFTRAAHWTMFSVGLLSLAFSIAATAASGL